jgi:hypothetical protein
VRARWALAWLAGLPVVLARAGDLHESDTFWQVRAGLLILDEGRLPTVDTFSWTASGRPWELNSWGFDVVLALAYRIGSLPAVAVGAAALAMVAAAALLWLAARLGATPAAGGLMLVASQIALVDWLGGRPQLIDYAAVPALLVLLMRWHAGGGVGSLAAIAAVQVGWVNLHSVAPLGVGLCVAAALGAALDRVRLDRGVLDRARTDRGAVLDHARLDRRAALGRAWRFAGPTVVAALAVLANPRGAGLLRQGAAVHRESTDLIREWLPPDPTEWTHLAPLLIAAAGLAVCLRQRRAVPATALVLLGGAGLVMLRFGPMAALVGAAAAAGGLSAPPVRAWAGRRRVVLTAGATAGVLALSALAAPALGRLGRPEVSPVVVRALPAGCRLLNEYILGGHVILHRPDVRVSLDSRNDLYGASEVRRLQAMFDSPASGPGPVALDEMGVTCVLTRTDRPLAARLRTDPTWHVAADDGSVVAFTR